MLRTARLMANTLTLTILGLGGLSLLFDPHNDGPTVLGLLAVYAGIGSLVWTVAVAWRTPEAPTAAQPAAPRRVLGLE